MSRVVRKITKPISKVLDKVVPNEIKPALPYLAAIAPVIGPMGAFGSTIGGLSKLQAAGVYGLGSLGAQLAQEGSDGDFDLLPVAMAAGTGYLAAPGKGISSLTTNADKLKVLEMSEGAYRPQSYFQSVKDLGIKGLQGAEKFLQAPQGTEGFKATAKALTKAAAPGVTTQVTQDAINFAKQAQADYEAELAEYNKFIEDQNLAKVANDEDRARAIYNSMINAGAFTVDTIKDTLDQLNLPSGFFAYGGRVEKAEGGIMDLGGREMDMRAGGFIPIGAKERADDVPARLSKNEFVMTADAVRGAGGGNINLGAKRMYDTMNKLEARGRA